MITCGRLWILVAVLLASKLAQVKALPASRSWSLFHSSRFSNSHNSLIQTLPERLVFKDWPYCSANTTIDGGKPFDSLEKFRDHKLQAVFVFTRHGDRSPSNWQDDSVLSVHESSDNSSDPEISPFWSLCDPVVEPARFSGQAPIALWKGDCGLKQLSGLGARQLRYLGAQYARRYEKLFAPGALVDLHARSTDINRTIASAIHFVEGLRPDSFFSPHKVKSLPTDIDPLALASRSRKTLLDYYDPTPLADLPKLRAFPAPLSSDSAIKLWDVVAALKCHGFTPCYRLEHDPSQCLADHYLERVADWADQQFATLPYTFTSSLTRSILNFEVRVPLQHMEKDGPPQFHVLAVHDSTLGVMLGGLRVPPKHWPAYASHLTIEVWKRAEQPRRFRVFYNGFEICTGNHECRLLEDLLQ